jgi:hypothetical protein
LKLAQFLPLQMAAEPAVQIIQAGNVRVREKRLHARHRQHVHQHQMVPPDQIHVADEAFRQRRVIQRGQEHQQRAPAQPQPDEHAQFIKVRRGDFRLQGVKRIAARAVMGLAVFGAHELFHLVRKRQQAEQIPLPLRRQPEHQRGGHETFQN